MERAAEIDKLKAALAARDADLAERDARIAEFEAKVAMLLGAVLIST